MPKLVIYLLAIFQAVVQYMSDVHEKKYLKVQPVKHNKSWTRVLFFWRSINKQKRRGLDLVAA